MKYYKIPYTTNNYISSDCKVYVLNDDRIDEIFPDYEEKYSLVYKSKIIKTTKWRIIALLRFGYCPEDKFGIDYSYKSPFEKTTYIISKVNLCNGYALINGMKFMQSPQWKNLYCNIYGVIYDLNLNRFRVQKIDKDGYHRFSPTKSETNYAVHRFVYSCWHNVILTPDIIIHHMDSDKSNNYYLNLESTTSAMNTRYSILLKEKKLDVYYNEDDIHKMCQMMQDNKTYREIAQEFNINPNDEREYKNFRGRLNLLLQHKSSWVDISSQYDFSNYTGNKDPNMKYTTQDIENIRYLRSQGYTCNQLADMYNTTAKYISAISSGKKRPNG